MRRLSVRHRIGTFATLVTCATLASTALVSTLSAAPAWAAGGLVGNHGFETPSICPAGSEDIPAGSTLLGPWSVTGSSSDAVDLVCSEWMAKQGQQSLELNGSGPGSISQRITDTAGKFYYVLFWLAGDVNGGPAIKTMQMQWNNDPPVNFKFNITGKTASDMQWKRYDDGFLSTGSDVVTFTGTSPGNFGAVIDDVRVSTTP